MTNVKLQITNEFKNPKLKACNDNTARMRNKMKNNKCQITNECEDLKPKVYDLEERTALFGESIIDFVKTLEEDLINRRLMSQLIDSSTSIGANYMEADAAESKRDFMHKIGICKKESKETKHWLRLIAKANPNKINACRCLWQEAQELTLIFSSIIKSCR